MYVLDLMSYLGMSLNFNVKDLMAYHRSPKVSS